MIHTRNLTAGKWCIVRTADVTWCLRAIEPDEPIASSAGDDSCPACEREVLHARSQRPTRTLEPDALVKLQEECR